MNKITPSQNRKLHLLLTQTGMMEHKADLVKEYSCINSESSKDLLSQEAKALINHLEKITPPQPEQVEKAVKKDQTDRMRKKLFYYGYMMKWDEPTGAHEKGFKPSTLCYRRVQNWCLSNRCSINKQINDYTAKELAQVVSQLEQVYKSFLKQIR
jgi:hypothetical protein